MQKNALKIALIFTTLFFVILSVDIFFFKGDRFLFLVWNVLLSAIPFFLSTIVLKMENLKSVPAKITKMVIGVIWFVFFPNAPYLLTDLIHIETGKYIMIKNYKYVYNPSPTLWFDFFMIIIAVMTGVLLGYFSLRTIHSIFENKSKIVGWLFVVFVSFASGYGIYLGRFERWNSWEVFMRPEILVKDIFKSVDPLTFRLVTIFGFLWLFIYIALFVISNLRKN